MFLQEPWPWILRTGFTFQLKQEYPKGKWQEVMGYPSIPAGYRIVVAPGRYEIKMVNLNGSFSFHDVTVENKP